MNDPRHRFTDTVNYYDDFRPTYPEELINFICDNFKLKPQAKVVDVGSGTGKFTELLLKRMFKVYGVEPNQAMRKVAEKNLKRYENFFSIDGTAEDTFLPEHQIDAVTVAQAFHWFDLQKAKVEFLRILKPAGHVALIWNFRDNDASKFMLAYEHFLEEFGTDYSQVNAEKVDEAMIQQFYSPKPFVSQCFLNKQIFDFNGLKGRVLSTSYLPKPGVLHFDEMIANLEDLFNEFQQQGNIEFIYRCRVYCGELFPLV